MTEVPIPPEHCNHSHGVCAEPTIRALEAERNELKERIEKLQSEMKWLLWNIEPFESKAKP